MIHAALPWPTPQPHLYDFSACAAEQAPAPPPLSERERERAAAAAAAIEFAPYRGRTVRLLHRYFRTSLEIGRLPGILGREFFRSRVSSRKACTFEDEVIFATDLDRCVSRLTHQEQQLLALLIFEDHERVQVAAITGLSERHVRRIFFQLLDTLSRMFLEGGYLRPIAGHEAAENLVNSRKFFKRG